MAGASDKGGSLDTNEGCGVVLGAGGAVCLVSAALLSCLIRCLGPRNWIMGCLAKVMASWLVNLNICFSKIILKRHIRIKK
jgi:hypothetical protein